MRDNFKPDQFTDDEDPMGGPRMLASAFTVALMILAAANLIWMVA